MALLDPGTLQPGQVLFVDQGLAGAEVDRHLDGLGAILVRPDRKDKPARFGTLGPVRQWIESIIDTLKGQLGLEQHGGRTPAGLHARIAQRLLASPRPAGSTGSSASSTSAPWSPTTTEPMTTQPESII